MFMSQRKECDVIVLTPGWNEQIDVDLIDWLSRSVKGWDDLTPEQATALRTACMDSIEDGLLLGTNGSCEVGGGKSTTGTPVTYDVSREEMKWAYEWMDDPEEADVPLFILCAGAIPWAYEADSGECKEIIEFPSYVDTVDSFDLSTLVHVTPAEPCVFGDWDHMCDGHRQIWWYWDTRDHIDGR